MPDPIPSLQMLGHAERGFDVGPADIVAVTLELEPGSAGAPAHRHPGPVFGYVVRGEVLFELEGEPERVVMRAGVEESANHYALHAAVARAGNIRRPVERRLLFLRPT